jgi:uncharacterized protein (DUF433 family)
MAHTPPDLSSFPNLTYRQGASGHVQLIVQGSGVRVQTLVTVHQTWGWSVEQIAEEYDLSTEQVQEVLTFYAGHKREVDAEIDVESALDVGSC